MNKIEKMIKELCPNGVEWKKLGEVLQYEQPTKYIVKNTDYIDNGIPVLTAGKTFILGYTNENNYYPATKDNPVILFDDFTTAFKWIDFNFKVKSSAVKLLTLIDNKNYIFKYIYYAMQSIHYATLEHSRQWIEKYSNIQIPVPPLAVQAEIVKILDNFTELTAELTARKKQYEYYRDKLLSFDNILKRGGVIKKLGEVSKIIRGASPRPINKYITDKADGMPWIKIGDVKTENKYITETKEKITLNGVQKSKIVNVGDFILSNSMSFGRPYISKIKGCIHDGWLSISKFEKYLLSDFLYYSLTTSWIQQSFKQNASSGTVQNLNINIVKDVNIPIPPLEVQAEIVGILDKFESMCNSLTEGLPAEIEARKKQYEYYRDKLLSFTN